jgi:hypothetical protein
VGSSLGPPLLPPGRNRRTSKWPPTQHRHANQIFAGDPTTIGLEVLRLLILLLLLILIIQFFGFWRIDSRPGYACGSGWIARGETILHCFVVLILVLVHFSPFVQRRNASA